MVNPHPVVPLRLEGLRVLVVEDNALNQQAMLELLQAAGVTVELAEDGGEAIKYLIHERRCYNIVLMDLQLPTVDGYQTTRSIRADPRCRLLPIIAMSAHTRLEHWDHCLAAGMNGYLSKPFDFAQLLDTLARWTGKRVTLDSISTATDTVVMLPPRLPGLDLATALQRLGGDNRLLGELLKRVAEDYDDAATTVDAALSQGDPLMARRLVHTLRGVAGSIGATALQDAATAVEQSLLTGALPEESLVQTLVAALAQTLASIALVRRAWVPSPRLDSPAGPALKRRLRELLVSLERQVLSAGELFHSLRQSLLQAQQELPVEPLGRCIERLDFKTASRLLCELASRLGIPLEGGDLAG